MFPSLSSFRKTHTHTQGGSLRKQTLRNHLARESNKTNNNEKRKGRKGRKSPREKNGFLIIDRKPALYKTHSGGGGGGNDDDDDDANNNKEQCDGLYWFSFSLVCVRARALVCVQHVEVERKVERERPCCHRLG